MTAVTALLRRVALVVVGYLAACVAASVCGHALALVQGGIDGIGGLAEAVGPLWISLPLVAVIAGTFAAMPAGISILAAEVFSLRSPFYFAFAGGVAGAVALLMLGGVTTTLNGVAAALNDQPAPAASQFSLAMALPIISAGIVCGLVYWAIAGRGSGGWRGASAPALSGS